MTPGDIAALCRDDPGMQAALEAVAAHGPPGAWIGAGFLRNAVWDERHGRLPDAAGLADLGMVFHDAAHPDAAADAAWEARLRNAPALPWSVTNQARMHGRYGHAPYRGVADAIAHWPETATANAALRHENGGHHATHEGKGLAPALAQAGHPELTGQPRIRPHSGRRRANAAKARPRTRPPAV